MMPVFEMSFVLGFLLTSMPAFTHGPRCRPAELIFSATALAIALVATLFAWTPVAEAASFTALLTIAVALARRLRAGNQAPPEEYRFVAFGILAGLAGAALRFAIALGAPLDLPPRFADRLTSLGLVLSLVLGLGGLLVPTFAQFRDPLLIRGVAGPHERRGRRELYTGAIVLLALAFVLEVMHLPRAGSALRAAVAAAIVLVVWRPWRTPGRATAAAWALWISGWMVALGLAGAALDPAHEIGALHLTFLGGFALLTLGVATRVVVSHGRQPLAIEQTVLTGGVVAAILAALAARLGAEAMPANGAFWLGASGALWCGAWGWWGAKTIPLLTSRPTSS
jgi:uncharacterized protein involved in response to NO